MVVETKRLNESSSDFIDRCVGLRLDFRWCLVLDWMRDVHRIEVWPSQRRRLRAGRQSEFVRRDGDGGDAHCFEPDCVVQTARCARPSIG